MECRYTLEWLDSLINVSLNPARTKLDEGNIAPEQIQYIISRIEEEKTKHQTLLNNQVFSLLEENKIEVLVRLYYASLIFLLDQAWHNRGSTLFKNPQLKEIQLTLIRNLEALIAYIEARFPNYLNMDQRASIIHLLIIKKELAMKVCSLKPQLEQKVNHKPLTDIVFSSLDAFLASIKVGVPVTLRDILYMQGLVKKLRELSERDYIDCSAAGLNELLICLNFNSQAYINYLTHAIKEKINTYPDSSKELEVLLLLMKDFYQMNTKPGMALNFQEKDLKAVIGNWFSQEVQYLEKKLNMPGTQLLQLQTLPKPLNDGAAKLICALTVDQISLVFRAAFECKIIIANSLNAVFKQIVPFLSTSLKENLSPDSMRSKSYAAEERDKDILVQILEKLILKIKGF